MSFWDNVKKFAQPYADEDYDDYDEDDMDEYEEEAAEPAPRRRPSFSEEEPTAQAAAPASEPSSSFSGHVVNMNTTGKQDVVLFHIKAFDEVSKAADELRARKAVVLNMEGEDKTLTRRLVDFLSGVVYALDGNVRRIAATTYLFCPHNMNIVGDLENFQGEVDSYI